MSWRSPALCAGGVVVCTLSWAARDWNDVDFLRGLLLLLTLAGFVAAGVGGGACGCAGSVTSIPTRSC
jgi:hypothetical protein